MRSSDTRIVYLAPRDILIARVARKCMMHLCEALIALGADVELVSMRVRTVASEPTQTRSVWDVYGVTRRFRLTMVPTPLRQERLDGRLAGVVVLFYRLFVYPLYALRAYRRAHPDGSRPVRTVFYSRNYGCVAGVMLLRKLLRDKARVVLEVHVPPRGRLHCALVRRVDGVACQSASLQKVLAERGLLDDTNSIGRHGGFSPELTECARLTREEARKRLGWCPTDRVACYTGKVVWGMREIELLVSTADLLARDGVRVVIVGGRADQGVLWREEVARRGLANVEFVGFIAPSDVPLYQMAADVLLLYYPSGSHLNDFRSPGKLFEYMASGTPAVVSDYLSIREVIRDGENGLLVPPDRPDLLAAAVKRVVDDPILAGRLSSQASADSAYWTWTETARATLALIRRL